MGLPLDSDYVATIRVQHKLDLKDISRNTCSVEVSMDILLILGNFGFLQL